MSVLFVENDLHLSTGRCETPVMRDDGHCFHVGLLNSGKVVVSSLTTRRTILLSLEDVVEWANAKAGLDASESAEVRP